jgi:hypothetical protein
MPVRRRMPKVRVDPAELLEAWGPYFEFGQPGFAGELEELVGEPAAAVRGAWREFGAEFMRTRQADCRTPWAVKQFGAPPCR